MTILEEQIFKGLLQTDEGKKLAIDTLGFSRKRISKKDKFKNTFSNDNYSE